VKQLQSQRVAAQMCQKLQISGKYFAQVGTFYPLRAISFPIYLRQAIVAGCGKNGPKP
jgi:hypothetical protein